MENIKKHIDQEIDRYLSASGKTLEWLAEQLDVTTNTLCNKRKGRTDWKFSEVVKLSELVGQPISKLSGIK